MDHPIGQLGDLVARQEVRAEVEEVQKYLVPVPAKEAEEKKCTPLQLVYQ